MWEITDNNGTLYSGKEEEITIIFEQIKNGETEEKWNGDLRLIQIIDIHK